MHICILILVFINTQLYLKFVLVLTVSRDVLMKIECFCTYSFTVIHTNNVFFLHILTKYTFLVTECHVKHLCIFYCLHVNRKFSVNCISTSPSSLFCLSILRGCRTTTKNLDPALRC